MHIRAAWTLHRRSCCLPSLLGFVFSLWLRVWNTMRLALIALYLGNNSRLDFLHGEANIDMGAIGGKSDTRSTAETLVIVHGNGPEGWARMDMGNGRWRFGGILNLVQLLVSHGTASDIRKGPGWFGRYDRLAIVVPVHVGRKRRNNYWVKCPACFWAAMSYKAVFSNLILAAS